MGRPAGHVCRKVDKIETFTNIKPFIKAANKDTANNRSDNLYLGAGAGPL